MPRLRRSPCLLLAVLFLCIHGLVHVVRAQNRTRATTHPDEARALNSIFATWKIRASNEWNISGELCSGAAIDNVSIDDGAYNPMIKCTCTFANSTCRITALKVYAIDVVGSIPDELWTLEYLTNLNLAQNFLTGPLSPAIGNLTRMEWMTFGINALSGPVPKEIGLLTNLKLLSISSNNFSGSMPAEIGSCTKLQQIYIDSSGLGGEIPLSFANLVEMQQAWMMDLEFTGRIPDFIGNWTKLTTLRIVGTGLSGPIPSSFSNLTSLTELRLGDISNGSSTLEFIKNMKSLSTLVLRNNNLTGEIPSDIGDYSSLQQVDLSFNKLHGPIPSSLFNLTRLTHLFLGNNTLNGSLPTQKSQSLSNIDVSYNNLSGILPSWVSLPNSKFNLVANNFTLEGLDNRVLSGLNCLQKNFPCNRGKGIYYNFSINCGGPDKRSVSRALFEKDDADLGPSSFFVNAARRWAASSIGLFAGSSSNAYIASSLSQFTNTSDSELFQTARLSASSLRYYGLGLENGGYTVTLQFAEIQMEASNSWKGLGRRRFDIYVQGRLVEKDFDVLRTAGGSTNRAVHRVYKANVTENYIEVHLFWAGKGTCCIPIQGAYGPIISAVSAAPDFRPTVDNKPPSKGKNKTGIIVGVIVGLGLLSILAGLGIFIIRKRRKPYTDDEELLSMEIKPYTFTYSELKSATQDFNLSNKLGEGGFGPVYKGNLKDGREVAVKLLSVGSRQGKGQFVAEIVTISTVLHRNLVTLYGCCFEGDHRLLVYEYLPNGSLDQALFGDKSIHLDWSTRFEICLGVARGLVYLHEEARVRIVHRDVKASNILLDSELVPKVSDFGLAKLYHDKKTHISTGVAGTIGYLAPEYAMRGHLTEKTDVYAFGVVALELVSGRPNSDEVLDDDKKYLLEWAWNLHEKGREVELIDDRLSEFNVEEVKRVIGVALLCTQASHSLRPPMSRVVAMLSGDVEVSDVTSKPGYLTDWRYDDITTSSGFQTKETDTSSSKISPGNTDSLPMLGAKINLFKKIFFLLSTMPRLRRPPCLLLTVWFLCIYSLVHVVRAQNRTGTITHPDDARALNSIFATWKINASNDWNISGELCSGAATNGNVDVDDPAYNPIIKCACTFANSTCRITALKVYSRDVVGSIPDELWTLEHLTNLNLGQNLLTGPLSPAIGNLIRMEWMTFGINALSGPVPKEIGLLTNLKMLSIGSNNFSGSMPAEIGSCTKLQQIYIDSSGLSGEIPLSFANLVELQRVWMMDLEVTGRIPEFIGNWTKLIVLRIVGTGLSGPIPSSFSNLTSLTELRLGDISNGSSSLEFIKDMKNLSILVLRNSNLTGEIPSDIGEYSSLREVDLSFNKLHGPIPSSLFNLTSLSHLFLGNNTLNGSLPTQKSQSLRNIDVSYNNFSGSLPSWVSLPNSNFNLVANSFTLEGLDNRVLSGLNCLQKNFRCSGGKGIYYNFSINCGGPDITSVSGALYDKDDADLGPSSFFVNAARRWAVSSIGRFAGSSNNRYTETLLSQFTNTSDSELFQTARLSPSSIRYYGLELENGVYNVTLQFAEIQMTSSNSWTGFGRRRFDIYVQGRLVEKDFDVRRTAGGFTDRAVRREYKANVTENYLEVHLFWAGKGTCCIPIQGAYGPIISAVSAAADFTPTVSNKPPSKKNNRTGVIVGVIVGVGLFSFLAGVVIFTIRQRRKPYTDDEELLSMEIKPYTFTYSELKSATQDFNLSNKLGEGGFGPVYKGNLKDGREVAVKLLSVGSRQGKGQFVAEIVTISTVLHRNLVTLYGCCFEGDHRLLVYEYLPNGSLDQALFVVLLYQCRGYLAPEYAMRGHLTEKTDVYAFGVVALELVSGRPNSDEILDDEKKYLLEWAWNLHEKSREVELIDDRLSEFNVEEVKRVIGVALLCTQASHSLRPPMSRVVAMLPGDVEVSDVTSKPGYLTDWRFDDITRDVEVSHVTFEPGYLTDWRFDDITTSSLRSFQTTETNTSGSKISPRKADSEPMLGAQDQFWKRTMSLL
ncbi:hypothetical protein HID58_005750 [Brassica napus]|uniref:non-specific serine/threonine protein kinase n=1 Tax=Brassica napus TaxID=3708 RepID=A0ABQ8E9I1_BRANA|nr:hypothetical protein HID58_005750 [Brassica napus]